MTFVIRQNDTSPALTTRLTDDGDVVDISGYNDVEFHMEDEYERVVIDDDTTGDVVVTDPSIGEVEYLFDAADTSNPGRYRAEWEVEFDDGSIETFPSEGNIIIKVVEEIG